MALNSFIRDFGMNNIAKSNRDTIQGNIVSTFQAGEPIHFRDVAFFLN